MDFGVWVGTSKMQLEDGEELEKKGVKPDIACLPAPEDLDSEADPCLSMAAQLATKAIRGEKKAAQAEPSSAH